MRYVGYFAYGSNMNPRRLEERGVEVSDSYAAHLANYCLVFNKVAAVGGGVGYANVRRSRGTLVEGVLYLISRRSLKALDRFEGTPRHYYRTSGQVYLPGLHQTASCEVYVAHPSAVGQGLRPTQEYLNHLLAAWKYGYISESYYEWLRSRPTRPAPVALGSRPRRSYRPHPRQMCLF